ncbi:FG-GAP repeat domain-containing protein, partial [Planctomycetota bacterium]
ARFQYLARGNSLFRNNETDRFEDVSVSHGVTLGRWSWGSLFADVNNDGWDDLLVANGYLTGQSIDDL